MSVVEGGKQALQGDTRPNAAVRIFGKRLRDCCYNPRSVPLMRKQNTETTKQCRHSGSVVYTREEQGRGPFLFAGVTKCNGHSNLHDARTDFSSFLPRTVKHWLHQEVGIRRVTWDRTTNGGEKKGLLTFSTFQRTPSTSRFRRYGHLRIGGEPDACDGGAVWGLRRHYLESDERRVVDPDGHHLTGASHANLDRIFTQATDMTA